MRCVRVGVIDGESRGCGGLEREGEGGVLGFERGEDIGGGGGVRDVDAEAAGASGESGGAEDEDFELHAGSVSLRTRCAAWAFGVESLRLIRLPRRWRGWCRGWDVA